MTDFIQSIGLLAVGGAIGVGSAWLQRSWSRAEAREAEERASARQRREERVQSARDFVDIARQSEVREREQSEVNEYIERGLVDSSEDEERISALLERLRRMPRRIEISPVAELAKLSAPTDALVEAIEDARVLAVRTPSRRQGDLTASLRKVEEFIDQYVAGH